METKQEKEVRVVPLGRRVLIRKQEDRKETQGGILLPDSIVIPQITGIVIEISLELENDYTVPIKIWDKVLFNPSRSIPVDLEIEKDLVVVDMDDIVAVFKESYNERNKNR